MTALDIATMRSRNGLYVLMDERLPTHTVAIVCMGADEVNGKPGSLYAMRLDRELTNSASMWPDTIEVVGGPYSLKTIGEEEVKHEGLVDGQDFWRNLAVKMMPMVTTYRDFKLGGDFFAQEQAYLAQTLLDAVKTAIAAEEQAAANAEAAHL